MGGSTEVYTSIYERTEFNYANVRKATYRGSNSMSLDLGSNLFHFIQIRSKIE